MKAAHRMLMEDHMLKAEDHKTTLEAAHMMVLVAHNYSTVDRIH